MILAVSLLVEAVLLCCQLNLLDLWTDELSIRIAAGVANPPEYFHQLSEFRR